MSQLSYLCGPGLDLTGGFSQVLLFAPLLCKLGLLPFGTWLCGFYALLSVRSLVWYVGFFYVFGLCLVLRLLVSVIITFGFSQAVLSFIIFSSIMLTVGCARPESTARAMLYLSTLGTAGVLAMSSAALV